MGKFKKAKQCLEGTFKKIQELELGKYSQMREEIIQEDNPAQKCQNIIETYSLKLQGIQEKTTVIQLR